MRNYLEAFKIYAVPSGQELLAMIASSAVGGFVFSFDKWGSDTFDLNVGIHNFLLYAVMIFLLLSAIEFGRRFWATKLGYKTEYRIWWIGILISLFFVFFTQGWLKFLIPGGFYVRVIPHLRLGHHVYRLKMVDLAKLAIAGTFAGVFFTVLLSNFVAWEITVMYMIIIIAGLVPIDIPVRVAYEGTPHSSGSAILFGSRSGLAFTLVLVLTAFLLLKIFPFWATMVLAFILASIAGLGWLWFKEISI